ncbi:putative nucleotide phosphoribosyltransferase [Campylobacter iguaniorum]|uniref:Putative nucleotide phosphoribosyltransferase n=1 Tax=Campylobacter iguaniorum TaxID=1244531 RepID=A0A076FF75_9BACT|nr:phosphoribosyltransferase family protein [Campylobacter iguaniorum]AII14494.1 putative nucleotide phosphoribosyltransferase [Campylobacter iguaniorum]ALV24229.1 putative nucleotide phosphoribosyltransferase [Campylobacter iguaniorum]
MTYYSYSSFEKDVKVLSSKIQNDFAPEVILAVARGGLTLAHAISMKLNNRNCFCLNSIHYEDTKKLDTINIFNVPDLSKFKKVLIVDDMVDSGESIVAIKRELLSKYPNLELKIATIFYKSKALLIPDYSVKEANDWIEFFWERID